MNSRLRYFIIVLVVIVFGIFSRKIDVIPLCIGDILYAVMIYYVLRTVFPDWKLQVNAAIALAFCWIIEIAQLYHTPWLTAIRQTTLGHYALGQGFLWSDLFAYLIGICTAFSIDKLIRRRIQVIKK